MPPRPQRPVWIAQTPPLDLNGCHCQRAPHGQHGLGGPRNLRGRRCLELLRFANHALKISSQLHKLDGTPRRFPAEATARPQVVFAGSVS